MEPGAPGCLQHIKQQQHQGVQGHAPAEGFFFFHVDGIITIRNKDSVINLSVDKSMVSDIRQYNMVHRYPNREYFFLNTKGKKITSSSALATIQEKLEEVNNINTTTLALKGVSKLIQKGLTLSEIKYLTGFETKKIEDVSRWLMNQEDVESVINNKLNLIDI